MIPWRLRRKLEQLWLESFRFLPGDDTWEVNQGDATASLIAVGDIALGDGVEKSVAERGVSHILRPVRELFAGDAASESYVLKLNCVWRMKFPKIDTFPTRDF